MGYRFIDQYSYLHFVVGATVFYWNISLFQWFLIHTLFEIVENTPSTDAALTAKERLKALSKK